MGTLGVHNLSILADGAGTSGAPSPRGRPRILSALALAQVPPLGACLRWPAPQAELVLGSAALGTVSRTHRAQGNRHMVMPLAVCGCGTLGPAFGEHTWVQPVILSNSLVTHGTLVLILSYRCIPF